MGKRAPVLTGRVLDGLTTAFAAVMAGGPADIGIDDNSEDPDKRAAADEEWDRVVAADDWIGRVVAHRATGTCGDPPPRVPAAVRRGLDLAVKLAGADLAGAESGDFTEADMADFTQAAAWLRGLDH